MFEKYTVRQLAARANSSYQPGSYLLTGYKRDRLILKGEILNIINCHNDRRK